MVAVQCRDGHYSPPIPSSPRTSPYSTSWCFWWVGRYALCPDVQSRVVTCPHVSCCVVLCRVLQRRMSLTSLQHPSHIIHTPFPITATTTIPSGVFIVSPSWQGSGSGASRALRRLGPLPPPLTSGAVGVHLWLWHWRGASIGGRGYFHAGLYLIRSRPPLHSPCRGQVCFPHPSHSHSHYY